ncbi:ArsR/SmtB family transcription factor [Allosalinactinospora lopnorensis]|uniref:ArsR/SmtB family transcription factor n=1 Tax=Allosalinactinospora lopnorensis TaxID=1352348 RepID=UPI000623C064|nr:metalloregulator ArsR/SmtB family transcription factor [Allosalinactinospora lopnorensis]
MRSSAALSAAEPSGAVPAPPPSTEAAFDEEAAALVAHLLKAIADPTRLRLLAMIRHASDGAACVQDLADALDIGQPTASHHLKILVDAGLLVRCKRGKHSWYSVQPERDELVRGLVD